MVNWGDPSELAREHRVFAVLSLALAGVATWEFIVTLAFDWSIFNGRKKWQWPMLLYFICRICLVVQIWSITVYLNALTEVDCEALTWIARVSESLSLCVTSMILSLRAFSVWGRNRIVGGVLLFLVIGQFGLWGYLDSYWVSAWLESQMMCFTTYTIGKTWIYIITFSYTLGLDLLILCLMLKKLRRYSKSGGFDALLLNDGILFFVASVIANGTATILEAADLNPVLANAAIPFACVVSNIAATRLFRHTSEFTSLSGEKPTLGLVSPIAFRSRSSTHGAASQTFTLADMRGGQMDVERFAESQYEQNLPRTIHHILGQSDINMDTPKSPPM